MQEQLKLEMMVARVTCISQVSTLVIQSLLFITIFQITQADSISTLRMGANQQALHRLQVAPPHDNQAPPIDPMVLNPDSLYAPATFRRKRSTTSSSATGQPSKFVDACPSKLEVLTPYYATNSKGKLRTIVNSELMQQAIQVETCLRCNVQPECGCEQKYKWHRLFVLDPNEERATSQGLFMDWFLFPSNCVCRCKPGAGVKHFLRTVSGTRRHSD